MDYQFLKLTIAVIATIGLYSVLYRENKFYRFVEHVFLGLAAGWALVALWTESLEETLWKKMMGQAAMGGAESTDGYWLYAILIPIGLMAYFVFSRKNNWMSRIPIGIILGLWAGQQFQVWFNRYGPQIRDSFRPVVPNNWESFTVPFVDATTPAEEAARVAASVYPTQALTNLVFIFTIVCVLTYFLFSIEVKSKALKFSTTSGRWLLMIGFGAIFGSTVMMRFSLLIDRMHYVWIEWFKEALLPLIGGR